MNKLVIVINGKGGVGKDALCDALEKTYRIKNVSSITPIKKIASENGWNGEKDDRSRRFLAELKRIFTEYNDLPTKYALEEYRAFLEDENRIMLVHIREGSEIKKFVDSLHTPAITLLIKRSAVDNAEKYGNAADDEVENYPYDYIYHNDVPLLESSKQFTDFIASVMKKIFD